MRFLALLLLALIVAGCGPKTMAPTAPLAPPNGVHAVGDPTADDVRWVWIDATHVKKITTTSRWDAQLQRVIVGKIEVIYVCDYPNNFIGPLPSGHCWEDGTNCSG